MSLKEFARKRFLIVDELDSFRFATKKTLMDLDLKLIDTATNAQSVVAGFQNVNYDVILCNYELGKGKKNGQELLEELRHHKLLKFNSLFFIVTGEVEKNKVMGTIENEPDGYLVKPVTPQELQMRLSKALKMKEALRLINTAIDEGDYTAALAYCDRKLAEDSKYTQRVLRTKAWLLVKTGDLDAAQAVYELALTSSDAAWANYGLARVHIQRKRYQEAEALLNKIIAEFPGQVEALDLLADIKRRIGKTDEAQKLVERAINLSPNSLVRQKQHADLCLANNDPNGALESYRKVVKLGDHSVYAKPEQYFQFAKVLTEQAASENAPENSAALKEAMELLNKSKRRFESIPFIEQQATLASANLKAILGETEEAQAILNTLLPGSTPPDLDSQTFQIAAEVYAQLGDNNRAEELLEHAADIAEGDFVRISSIYDQLNSKITLEDRQQAASMNKQGIKLYEAGNVEAAAAQLRKALPLTPRHISLNLNLIQVLLKLHKKTGDQSLLADVEKCFHKVRHMPKEHREYKRFAFLKKQFEGRR